MDRSLETPLDAALEDDDDLDADDTTDSSSVARRIDADSILDSLLPQSIDWRDTVRRYPVVSVLSVGLIGYLVGRTKGATIMSGLTAGLSAAMMRQLSDVFEGDFFDY
jgi:hypothetical protein